MPESMTSEKRLAELDKQRQALELRKAGLGYEAIALQLGYRGPSGAHYAVKAALQRTLQEPADALRALESHRLDDMLRGLWVNARKGNVAAIDRVLKIMGRRADLLGLDAPKRVEDVTDYRKAAERVAAELGKPELVGEIERDMLIRHEAMREAHQ